MTRPISLLLGVHAHQPVGNFSAVLDDAHVRCYSPFLRTLCRYPEFRFAVHFSGWLLDRLLEDHPNDMALLKTMVARGQVEMFGGGDCEPVLAAIPYRDRVGQIEALSNKLLGYFGAEAHGSWLTERVYIPTVVPALADCGMCYVTVDDYHFMCTGKTEEELDGYYTTEEDGRRIDLFPISESLRYRLPFSPAQEAVSYIEGLARRGQRAAVYFDDIEKFGIWPETHAWVYEKGWLAQFIEGVLASPLIRTETYAGFHAREATRGIVYLPTTSYIEMNEWSLPAPAAAIYEDLVEREKREGRYALSKPFVRGGIWQNFFTRYPESNWMHKRMLALSTRLAALPDAQRSPTLTELLYRAQANDAYWHGLFGGLYLPHLRREIYGNLLALEAALDRVAPRTAMSDGDIDFDGVDERFLRSANAQVVIKLDSHFSICEFDAYALCHNFGDALTQRDEHYYKKLSQAAQAPAATSGNGIASAHDRVVLKHTVHATDVVPDARPRRLFMDRWTRPDGSSLWPEYHVGTSGAMAATLEGGEVAKRITLDGSQLVVTYRFSGAPGGRFETELNIAMPSCDGYSGRYILADGRIPCGFGQALTLAGANELTLDDRELKGALRLNSNRPVDVTAGPHFTVSQSEAGFEKIMQAACLRLFWPVDAAEYEITLTLDILPDASMPAEHQ